MPTYWKATFTIPLNPTVQEVIFRTNTDDLAIAEQIVTQYYKGTLRTLCVFDPEAV